MVCSQGRVGGYGYRAVFGYIRAHALSYLAWEVFVQDQIVMLAMGL